MLGIFISDVSGHGVAAALITSMLKTLIETSGKYKLSPSSLLQFINEKLSGLTGGNFLTAFYGIYNHESRSLTFSRAGHTYPLLIRHGKIIEIQSPGKILAMNKEMAFEEACIKLQKGDRVIFYTDGLTEAINAQGVMFEEKLSGILLQNPEESIESLISRVHLELSAFMEDRDFEDDVCVVGLEILE